jgi:hypothetical protein
LPIGPLTIELSDMIGEAIQNTETDGPQRNGGITDCAANVLAGSPQTNAGDMLLKLAWHSFTESEPSMTPFQQN